MEAKAKSIKKLGTKVLSYTKYLIEAKALLEKGAVNGMDRSRDVALALLYDNNKVVGMVTLKGETLFIVEA